ncbi:hypothetical protein XELAEV_18015630mg [Xenopus laevis]|uniref:Uncharacterized protein n=1 Tax=Xenopus laevis TaxID=8355 RepID=A0A974DIE9_XENLA|nr:hypothetical protein XELAEV_18015630mg [Xenopus laevis]
MVKLVPLFWKTDLDLLLCNNKDIFLLRVSKLLDCFSPKSMWFLWNIFSKGTHMLQCLCGKSLKKNKNPSVPGLPVTSSAMNPGFASDVGTAV